MRLSSSLGAAIVCALPIVWAGGTNAQAQRPEASTTPIPGTQLIDIPAALYDPTKGPAMRNVWRADMPPCGRWWGGPLGTITPPGFNPPPAPPDGAHGMVGFNYSSACRLLEGLASVSARMQGFFVRGTVYGEDVGNWRDGNGFDQRNGHERR